MHLGSFDKEKKYNKTDMNSSFIQSCRNMTFASTNVKVCKDKYDNTKELIELTSASDQSDAKKT